MNDFEKYFRENKKRLIHKWVHYFEIYDRHFSKYRGKEIVILEIGVFQGGSLQMWRDYFGPKAKIYGIDINPKCKIFEEDNIEILIGSQSDRNFLTEVKKKLPKIDILIDDGGHSMEQQIVSYEELYSHVKNDGVYLCEDLHTSYWLNYGGGHKRRGSFIEYSKNWIDFLNAYHSNQKTLEVSEFTRTTNSIHYYDSIVVVEKRNRPKPHDESTGEFSYALESSYTKIPKSFVRSINKLYNKITRYLRLKGNDLH